MHAASVTTLVIFITLCALVALVWKSLHWTVPSVQNAMAFLPTPRAQEAASIVSVYSWRDVSIRTADGEVLNGMVGEMYHGEDQNWCIFFHGNAYNVDHYVSHVTEVGSSTNSSILLVDYRGFGKSSGYPSADGLRLDGEAIVRYAETELGIQRRHILLHGYSMGCAVALHVAASFDRHRGVFACVALEAPFATFQHAAQYMFPLLRWLRPFMTSMFDNVATAALLPADQPLLVMHSEEDEVCPYHDGVAVWAAASSKIKKFIPSDRFSHMGPHTTREAVSWIGSHFSRRRQMRG